MVKKVTISDVAKLAGVSKSTVSRYLNQGYISDKNAAIIKKAITDTGFKSNFFAARLKTKFNKLIGIVVPRIDSYSAGQTLAGINEILTQEQYQSIIVTSELDSTKEIQAIHQFHQQGVDAIIVISVGITQEKLSLMQQYSTPTIFVGQQHPDLNYIKLNDEKAGMLLGQHLEQCQFKNCVYLNVNKSDKAIGIERCQGFLQAFNGNVHFINTDFSFEHAYLHAPEILKFKPDVIVGATDNIALGVFKYLQEKNIKIPNDIAVAGFGGYPVSEISSPALTTISFNFKLLGKNAAFSILKLLVGKTFHSCLEDNFKLLIRSSTQL